MRQSEIVTFIRLKEAIREHCDIVNALYDMVGLLSTWQI